MTISLNFTKEQKERFLIKKGFYCKQVEVYSIDRFDDILIDGMKDCWFNDTYDKVDMHYREYEYKYCLVSVFEELFNSTLTNYVIENL